MCQHSTDTLGGGSHKDYLGVSTSHGPSTDFRPNEMTGTATYRPQTAPGTTTPYTSNNHSSIHMVVTYTKGLSESFKNILVDIQVHFKGGNTIKYLLVAPNHKEKITEKRGAVYWYKCDRLECDEEYIR